MDIDNGDRLANEGPVLQLRDGRRLRLHYGYGGLRRIEKHFGSLQGLTDALSKGAGGEFFDAVFVGLLFGLWQSGITEADLEANIEPADIEAHGQTLSEALMLAFPQQAQAMAADANGASQNGSTGPGIITSQPLSAVGPTNPSGA